MDARDFDGVNNVVYESTSGGALDGVDTFTWTFWVNRDTTGDGAKVAAKRGTSGLGKQFMDSGSASSTFEMLINRATTNARAVAAASTFTTGTWFFVGITCDASTNIKIYKGTVGGGAPAEVSYLGGIGTNPDPGSGTISSEADGNYCIGARNSSGTDPFNGKIADFRVYNSVLSTSDMQTLMDGSSFGSPLWWIKLGEGSPETDHGSAGLNATVSGTTVVAGPVFPTSGVPNSLSMMGVGI
jgi:hypothetical protein